MSWLNLVRMCANVIVLNALNLQHQYFIKVFQMSQNTISINPTLRDFSILPPEAQVRLPIVKSLLSVSSATVWRMVRAKRLNAYKLTERTTTFNVGEIREFLAAKAGV